MATRPPRKAAVKNKTPAPIQISAEQILREAQERQEQPPAPPKQQIVDQEELDEFRLRKRKEFEDRIARNRQFMNHWIKYAKWEETQKEYARSRSIFERALDVDHQNISLWLKYVEMEMRNKFINHARNLWDRAVTLLPRVDQLWYKYAHMEETLGNVAGARRVFERWMEWVPDANAWMAYINLEKRYKEWDRARIIMERFVQAHPSVGSYLKFAKFEESLGAVHNARRIYENCIDELGLTEEPDEKLFVAFARFEERQREEERARAIYKLALECMPDKRFAGELYDRYVAFEKQHGDRAGIEQVIVQKKRVQYEEEIKQNPHNYDVWFDYIRMEENAFASLPDGSQAADSDPILERVRDAYERAIAVVPPIQEKRYWRRYIFLWINYALFEELEAHDYERTRQVYRQCVRLIPHKVFSFAKIWIMWAHFEIRQKQLDRARKVFGNALGVAPNKDKIFRAYLHLESQLGETERCRTLYQKFLEYNPANSEIWTQFSEMEHSLEEYDRARSLYELAIQQSAIDMPELLWKSYIDFEIAQEEFDRVRALYERLLERTKHVKVWVSFALFEISQSDDEAVRRARAIFQRGYEHIKNSDSVPKEERVMMLESWKDFEKKFGDKDSLSAVTAKLPRRVIRKRAIINEETNTQTGFEEYYDYIFPDDEKAKPTLKILERAMQWKRQKIAGADEQ